jgi:mono/diheme cytochrome c family protein
MAIRSRWLTRLFSEVDVKKILLGAMLTVLLLLSAAAVMMRLGLFPVSADGSHSGLEARVMPAVLHASVARRAGNETNPVAVNEENSNAGTRTYKTVCATCHGTARSGPSEYGKSFYPPAPRISDGLSQYTDAQLFWIIKHGIRNTGMPAWSGMLSDEEIWQVVMALKTNDRILSDR